MTRAHCVRASTPTCRAFTPIPQSVAAAATSANNIILPSPVLPPRAAASATTAALDAVEAGAALGVASCGPSALEKNHPATGNTAAHMGGYVKGR